jgi:hypothetical protein
MTQSPVPTYFQCFISLALGLAPLFIIFGVGALLGFDSYKFNRVPVHGPLGLLYSLVTATIMAALFAAFQKLGYFILGQLPRREADVDA